MASRPTDTTTVVHPDRGEGPKVVRRRRLAYGAFAAAATILVSSAVVEAATDAHLWGVTADRAQATAGGYDLEVKYPAVSRPALATPFEITVRRAQGFDGPVDIALDPEWMQMWDYQALYPEPSEWTGEPERLILTFEPPDGDVLRVVLDARIQAAQQSGQDGWVAVLDAAGRTAVRVDFHTTVRP